MRAPLFGSRAIERHNQSECRLQNLDPTANYVVTDLDQPAAPQELSGRELIERGLLVNVPERPSARLLTYHVLAKGK